MWQPNDRYPDPSVVVIDKSFAKYRNATASVECLATGCRFGEGPVWFGDANCLLWSDIPNNRIMRWDAQTGGVSVFRQPSNKTNGNTRDREGRLVSCEHVGRRVTRTEYDGSITVLADSYQGKRLNSPNDVIVASDGAIWFTDPVFGIINNYIGHIAESELPAAVYRIDPGSGAVELVADDVIGPNGLAFSPDGKVMYIVACRAEPQAIMAYDVVDGRRLARPRVHFSTENGLPDGFRVDVDGNIWCSWGTMAADPELDGVRVFNPGGEPIGQIKLPERCANVCFGGIHRNRLFMAASHGLYALYVNTQGVAGG